jgi:hypothetical protein
VRGPGEQLEQCALACAVLTDQANELRIRRDVDADASQVPPSFNFE